MRNGRIAFSTYSFYYENSYVLSAVQTTKSSNDYRFSQYTHPPEMFKMLGSYIKHVYPLRKRGTLEEVMSERAPLSKLIHTYTYTQLIAFY